MQRDGQMQTQVFTGRANYEPNSLAEVGEDGGPREDPKGGFRTFELPIEGSKVRLRAESFADHYSHARLFYISQSEIEQAHIATALVFELSKVSLPHVRARVVGNLRNVDEALAKRVATGLNIPLPSKVDDNSCDSRYGPIASVADRRQVSSFPCRAVQWESL